MAIRSKLLSSFFLLSSSLLPFSPYRCCCRREAAASLLAASRAPRRAARAGGSSICARGVFSSFVFFPKWKKTNRFTLSKKNRHAESLSLREEQIELSFFLFVSLSLSTKSTRRRHGPDPRRRGCGAKQPSSSNGSSRLQQQHELVGSIARSPPPLFALRRLSRRLRRLLRASFDLQRQQRQRHRLGRPKLPLQWPAGRPQQGDLRAGAGVGGDARRARRRARGEAARVRFPDDADRPGERIFFWAQSKQREIERSGEREEK